MEHPGELQAGIRAYSGPRNHHHGFGKKKPGGNTGEFETLYKNHSHSGLTARLLDSDRKTFPKTALPWHIKARWVTYLFLKIDRRVTCTTIPITTTGRNGGKPSREQGTTTRSRSRHKGCYFRLFYPCQVMFFLCAMNNGDDANELLTGTWRGENATVSLVRISRMKSTTGPETLTLMDSGNFLVHIGNTLNRINRRRTKC